MGSTLPNAVENAASSASTTSATGSQRRRAADAAPGRVGPHGREQRDRVQPRAADARGVAEAGRDRRGPRRPGGEHAEARHRREVGEHGRHRHVVEQRRPDRRRAEVVGADRLAGEAVLGDEARRLGRRRGRLGPHEPLDEARQAVARAAADDPVEEPLVAGGHGEGRVARGHPPRGVRAPQEVAVGDALAPAVT